MDTFETEQNLRQELSPDEKLVWTGQPKRGIVFRAADAFLIPFSLVWCGFAAFGFYDTAQESYPPFFMLWIGFFVLVGLYFVIGRFIVDAWYRARTFYGITEDRIIIKTGNNVKSLNIRSLSDIGFSRNSSGSGTITFGPVDYRYAMMQGMHFPGAKQQPKLEFISDVKMVYDKIIALQRQR